MKKSIKYFTAAAVLMLTAGCSDGGAVRGDVTQSAAVTEAKTEAAETDLLQSDAEDTSAGRNIPLISITSVSDPDSEPDFITKPVSDYVSRSVAMWTPGYVKPPVPYYEKCMVTVAGSDGAILADAAEAEVKVRGNWTTLYRKKPLRIKFAEKQEMLGLNGGAALKNWVLLAEYKDASMLRNKTALYISRRLFGGEYYAADSAFAEVEANGRYMGLYLLTELQQTGSHRVDVPEPEKDYTGTDIGYFMELDGYYTEEDPLCGFFVDYADNAPLTPYDGKGGSSGSVQYLSTGGASPVKNTGITIKSDIYSEAQRDFIASYVNNVYRIMYAAAYEEKAYVFNDDLTEISESNDLTPEEAVRAVVDIRSLADMYIISELTCDADIYWSSFFMSADMSENGSKKLTFEAPWDFDSSMGNKNRCTSAEGYYACNIIPDVNDQYDTINPWLAVLMYEDWYRSVISDEWTAAYDSGIFEDALEMIERDTAEYHDAFERNYALWDNIEHNEEFANELSPNSKKCRTQQEAAEYLESWLKTRIEFMNSCFHE